MSYGAGISSFKSIATGRDAVKVGEKAGPSNVRIAEKKVPSVIVYPQKKPKSKLEYTPEYCDSIESEYKAITSERIEKYKSELKNNMKIESGKEQIVFDPVSKKWKLL